MSMRTIKKKDLLRLLAIAEKQTDENESWIEDQRTSYDTDVDEGVLRARKVIEEFKDILAVQDLHAYLENGS